MEVAQVKQVIKEPVRVLASFAENRIRIHFFNWKERIYKVESMNMFHIEKDGNYKRYHFALSSGGNSYELSYDPVSLHWQLEEIVTI